MPALAIHGLRNETVYPGIAKAMPGSFIAKILTGGMFMNAYLKKGIEVLEALSVDRETGLTCAQAEENRKSTEQTVLPGQKGVTVAAFVGGRMRAYDYHANPGGRHCVWREPRQAVHGRKADFIECVGILAAIALSVVITVAMEGRSAKAFEELSRLGDETLVKAVRDGKRR